MKVTSEEPVMIAGYGLWEMEDGPARRSDGSEVETVVLVDLDEGEARKLSLGEGIASKDRPAVGTLARVTFSMVVSQKAGRDGIVRTKEKLTVVGFHAANGKPSTRTTSPTATAA